MSLSSSSHTKSRPAPLVYLTRVESFCASHRLHNKQLDEETNLTIFGKCNNQNGHGHNYKLEVTVKGHVDSKTGMVMNVAHLKTIIDENVMRLLDHKDVDKDVEYFSNNEIISTAENISVFIWNCISDKLPVNVSLHRIKLHETDKNIAEYMGE